MIDSKTAQTLQNLADETSGEEFKMMVLDMFKGGATEESRAVSSTLNAEDEKEDSRKVYTILRELGIPANFKGYNYLMEAIIYCLYKGGNKCSMTKQLYPTIAQKFGTEPARVERAMRHAIEVGCERYGTYTEFEKYFGKPLSQSKSKPNNSEFIYGIVTWIQHNT